MVVVLLMSEDWI